MMSRAFRRARSYESKCRGPKLCSTRGWYTRSRRCMGEEIHSTQKPMPYNLQEERANCEDPLGCENPPVPRRELRQAITLSDSMSQKFMCTGRGVACPLKSCTHSPKESSDSTTRMPGGTTVDSFHACPMPHREPYTDSDEAPLAASAVRAIRIEATNVGATDCDRGDSNPQSFASISKKAEIDGNSGVVSEPPRWMPPAKSAQGSIVSLHPKSATSLSKTPRCSPVGRSATMNKVPSNLYHSGSSLLFRILKATERQKHKCLKLLNDRPLLIAFLPSFILALLPLIGTFCILAVGLLPVRKACFEIPIADYTFCPPPSLRDLRGSVVVALLMLVSGVRAPNFLAGIWYGPFYMLHYVSPRKE